MDGTESTIGKTGPLETWEIERERAVYVPKTLTPGEREEVRMTYGRSLYHSFYNYHADQSAYLSSDDQNAYFDAIVRLARTHSQEAAVLMRRSDRYARDHESEFRMIESAHEFGREHLLTPEQREMYALIRMYRSSSPEEQRHIGEREKQIGVELLPPKQRDLFRRWEINKYRGNYLFVVTGEIIQLATYEFFDNRERDEEGETAQERLLRRARALRRKTQEQGTAREKNTPDDVKESDALILEAISQLFPSTSGLKNDGLKKELERLLGVTEEAVISQSPRT